MPNDTERLRQNFQGRRCYGWLFMTAALSVTGCSPAQPPSSAPTVMAKTPAPAPQRPTPEKEAPPQNLTAENFALSVDDEGGAPCVRVMADGDCLPSMEALQQAAPNLLDVLRTKPAGAVLMATVYTHLVTRYSQTLFTQSEPATTWWSNAMEPKDVFDREVYRFNVQPSAPDFERIQSPYFAGDQVVFFTGRMIGADHGSQVWEHRIDLSSKPWDLTRTELPAAMRARPGLSAKAEEFFGGPVEGYARGVGKAGSVYLSAKPQESAAKFVWRPETGPPERYSSWKELAAKHPEVNDAKALASLAAAMTNFPVGQSHTVITDVAAYKAEYTSSGWGQQKLRYQVDEIRVTDFSVDWEKMHDPRVEDDTITAFFRAGDRQPHRFSMTFEKFSETGWPERLETFHSSKLISDTRDGPGPSPAPGPAAPEPEPNRLIKSSPTE